MIKSDKYFSATQILNIGYYALGIVDLSKLSNSLNVPENIVKICSEKTKLRKRIVCCKDFQVSQILDEFATELDKQISPRHND